MRSRAPALCKCHTVGKHMKLQGRSSTWLSVCLQVPLPTVKGELQTHLVRLKNQVQSYCRQFHSCIMSHFTTRPSAGAAEQSTWHTVQQVG